MIHYTEVWATNKLRRYHETKIDNTWQYSVY